MFILYNSSALLNNQCMFFFKNPKMLTFLATAAGVQLFSLGKISAEEMFSCFRFSWEFLWPCCGWTLSPSVAEEQQQEGRRPAQHQRHGSSHGGDRHRRRFWIHRRENTEAVKTGKSSDSSRWKDRDRPEQLNEPGTLTHSKASGHGETCSWHSLISATPHVPNGINA